MRFIILLLVVGLLVFVPLLLLNAVVFTQLNALTDAYANADASAQNILDTSYDTNRYQPTKTIAD